MRLYTHITPESGLELNEFTLRRVSQLPWVDPNDLPDDAILQIIAFPISYGVDELMVVWIGDFGYYQCVRNSAFMSVVAAVYVKNMKKLLAMNPSRVLTLQ